MRDKELLELAAKAAGVPLEWDGHPDQWVPIFYQGKTYHEWNPLTDDGDALRLAVKLGLFLDGDGLSRFQAFYSDEIRRDNKPTKATRLAVTAIAAAIGEAMP